MKNDNLLTIKARFWMLLLMIGIWFSAGSWAAVGQKKGEVAFHPLEDIYTQVQDFLEQDRGGEGVSIQLNPLDSRLRLKQCGVPLSIDYQRNRGRSGRAIIEVRCVGATPWRIYVTAKISEMREVVVTIAPVLKGERVDVNNLTLEMQDLSRLRKGYYESKEQLQGMYAKRALQGGVVLTPQLLFVPNLIDKGDQVSIQIQRGELRVQMEGVAIEDGYRDGKIRVRNNSSGKIVEGIVVAPGRVLVTK